MYPRHVIRVDWSITWLSFKLIALSSLSIASVYCSFTSSKCTLYVSPAAIEDFLNALRDDDDEEEDNNGM